MHSSIRSACANYNSLQYSLKALRWVRLLCLCVTFLLFTSAKTYALNLGEMTVDSAVGERFYAVIKLENTRRVSAEQILVSLAPRSVYQRMGVAWEYFHTGLIFDVLADERDGIYLRIVSKEVVFEPYLDFVISVRWPSGFISKQYTVLLDMPLQNTVPSVRPVERAEAVVSDANGSLSRVTSEQKEKQKNEKESLKQKKSNISKATTPERVVSTLPSLNNVKKILDPEQVAAVASPVENLPELVSEELLPDEVIQDPVNEVVAAALPQESENSVKEIVEEDIQIETEALSIAREEAIESVVESNEAVEIVPVEESIPESVVAPVIENEAELVQTENLDVIQDDELLADSILDESILEEPALEESVLDQAEATSEEVLADSEVALEFDDEPYVVDEAETIIESVEVSTPVVVESEEALEQEKVAAQEQIDEKIQAEVAKVVEESSANANSWGAVSHPGDTLWAIARNIQKESGGRVVDIVNALFENNKKAFINDNANLLRVDVDLSVSLAQIKAVTPLNRRNALVNEFKDVAQGAASIREKTIAPKLVPVDDVQGVLSLVTQDETNVEASPLTEKLSRELEESSGEINDQLQAGSSRATTIEGRMDNLLSQYQALSEKTDQLKDLEESLNRSIAEKAQLERGLEADLPVMSGEVKDQLKQKKGWLWWLQLVVFCLLLGALIYTVFRLLKARRIQKRNEWVDGKWDNELLGEAANFSDDELSEMIKLKGESALLDQMASQSGQTDNILQELGDAEGAAELQASLYIAYERFEEAELLLDEAIQQQPTKIALKSQLLEVYAALGKEEDFERLAEQLTSEGDSQINNKISALRQA